MFFSFENKLVARKERAPETGFCIDRPPATVSDPETGSPFRIGAGLRTNSVLRTTDGDIPVQWNASALHHPFPYTGRSYCLSLYAY